MSAVTLSTPLVSADDFLKTHGDESGVELIDGVITRLPMPGALHSEVCLTAGILLGTFVKQHRLGRVMSNDCFVRTRTNPDGCRGADLLFISYSHLPADVPTPVGALTPPLELVVEVRSPSNTIPEMTDKANEYLRAGVMAVLVLDPQTETAGVFRLNELPQRFSNGDLVVLPEVSPTFAVPANTFFE